MDGAEGFILLSVKKPHLMLSIFILIRVLHIGHIFQWCQGNFMVICQPMYGFGDI